MTDDLVVDDGIGEITRVSWSAPDGLAYEEWESRGHTLLQINDSINWWVGDWLNYGERNYGETYAQAIEVTGWKMQQLADCKWVASKVPFSVRNENLSWTHHRHVCRLDPEKQTEWLDAAEQMEWTSRELLGFVKLDGAEMPAPDVPFSGSGHNYSEEALPEVVEYEQMAPAPTRNLPVISYDTLRKVQDLLKAVRDEDWRNVVSLAEGLMWLLKGAEK